jgi:hypothetical protein
MVWFGTGPANKAHSPAEPPGRGGGASLQIRSQVIFELGRFPIAQKVYGLRELLRRHALFHSVAVVRRVGVARCRGEAQP